MAEIAELAGQERPLTPLQRQLDGLARSLLWAGAGICAALTIVFLIRGNALGPSLLLRVSLAVAAIPEGLTAVVTITLAVGMRRFGSPRRDRAPSDRGRDTRLDERDLHRRAWPRG